MKYFLLNTKNYLKDRIVPIIILSFVFLYLTGEYLMIEKKSELKAFRNACEEKCLPHAGEAIITKNENTCWCYENNKTLIKKGE